MTVPAQNKTRKVKSKASIIGADGPKAAGNGRKKQRKSTAANKKGAASLSTAAPSAATTAKKTKQKRGRSATKKNLKKGASKKSLHSSLSSFETKSTLLSQDSIKQLNQSSSFSDLRALNQDSATGRGRALGRRSTEKNKRPRSVTGLDDGSSHHHRSPNRRLDMTGRQEQSNPNLLSRQKSNPNLSRQSSNPNLLSRQNSNQSLGGGGPRSLQNRARSLSTDGSQCSFNARRMNRVGQRGLKKQGSASGLSRQSSRASLMSRQSSRSSLYASSDDDEGRSRSRSRARTNFNASDDLQKIIGMIESSNNPDEILARKESPSRFERFAKKHRLSSRSLDSGVSGGGHSANTMADEDFSNDTVWMTGLRYIRLLPPHPRECRSDRIIRLMIWGAMVLDFIAAMVSITTYESVTMCCGKPIFELLESRINWNEFVRVFTYIYLVLIFLEIVPVFNKEIPLNLINPLIGFTITMAMFFDDRIGEAITMWTMEALAIVFEAVITVLKRKQHLRRLDRIAECDEELAKRDGKRWRRENNSTTSLNDGVVEDPYSDLESLSGASFYNSKDAEINRFRIERERRQLKANVKDEEIRLRYHFIGSAINITLVIISLSLIAGIGKNGGLCISNFEPPPIFKDDQLERCSACAGATGTCEVCDTTGGNQHQCYYPYQL